MALHILKTASGLPDLDQQYYHYATVKIKANTLLRRLLGQRAGSVSVLPDCDLAYPVLQAVPPTWDQGQKEEWQLLQQCYRSALHLALQYHCDAITIPLLEAEDPKFPAYIDYKIAVDTIREFLEENQMDVYLLAFRQSAFQMPALRNDVETFLSRNFIDTLPNWGSTPFSLEDNRFTTIAPVPPIDTAPAIDTTLTMPECSYGQSPRDYDTGRLPSMSELEDLLKATDAGFSETLLNLIDKTGKKDSDIYNKANVSRQHFSKIRNNPNYKPTKPTAIAFAIALELDINETRDLIGRAGYTLTNSSKFDVIIMYFIQKRNYNMFDINETLFEFDQSLLGA